ncbi:ankyrin repeat domain-containing protein [Phenylobacterium terrae]|uniref:ankyrin repeat domain-containing protein n=1 Tax=Phenylobacterium terrae TaxID=2665495 RepID=UPI0036727A41
MTAAVSLSAGLAQAEPQAELFAAIRAGDAAGVERLIGADPALLRARDASGATPLVAAAFKRLGIGFQRPEDNPVFALIARRISEPDLVEACLLGRRAQVVSAIAADPQLVKTATPNGRTLLHYAAYVGDAALVDALADRGADLDAPAAGVFLSPPIVQAILGGRMATLERLIARGANVNARLDDGSTPLHEAAQLGEEAMVRALIQAGADPKALRRDGRSPRDLAAARGHARIAELLDGLG